jgi:sulfur carrier protein
VVVTINGEMREINGAGTVSGLLDQLGINPGTVVVERNMNILRRKDLEREVLQDGDRIEIIQMVDGG